MGYEGALVNLDSALNWSGDLAFNVTAPQFKSIRLVYTIFDSL